MAIYHMQAKVVSRGSGRSAVAASAYMSCSRMYNDYDGIQHDYTRKQGLIYQEVMLPPMAPLEWNDREQLWNAVEENEKTKDSRLAREFVVALPVELDKDSNISLLQDFIKKNFVDMGMCADFAIHDTDGHNPHAHILLTVRPLNENGTWQYKTEKEYLCIKDGEEKGFTASEFKTAQKQGWEKQYRYKVGKKKEYLTSSVAQEKGYERIDKHPKSSRYGRQNPISQQWNSDEQLCIWRANWADAVNKMLARNQINATIDHRSFADQGITEQPTIHEGYIAQNMEKKHQWYTGRKETTIWEFDKPKKNGDHPTMKPIPLLAYPIMNSSMTNSLVLDPFGGSGSTLIACEQTGRICHTIELDEKFCDVIVKRYIEQVGSSAKVSVIRDCLTYSYDEIAPKAEDATLL